MCQTNSRIPGPLIYRLSSVKATASKRRRTPGTIRRTWCTLGRDLFLCRGALMFPVLIIAHTLLFRNTSHRRLTSGFIRIPYIIPPIPSLRAHKRFGTRYVELRFPQACLTRSILLSNSQGLTSILIPPMLTWACMPRSIAPADADNHRADNDGHATSVGCTRLGAMACSHATRARVNMQSVSIAGRKGKHVASVSESGNIFPAPTTIPILAW